MKEGYSVVENLTIPSDFGALNQVESLIDSVCSKLEIKEDYYGNVLVAVTEAVNNAILHGNKSNANLNVELQVGDKDTDFCFKVKDQGVGFTYEQLPDPTAPENIEKEHGRGVFLMRSLAEEVEFQDNGSTVTIYFSK